MKTRCLLAAVLALTLVLACFEPARAASAPSAPPRPASPQPATSQPAASQPAGSQSPASQPASTQAPGAGRFVDKERGFSLTPPAGWRPVEPGAFAVPGTLRAGWSPDDRTSILVFTTHLDEPITASFLLAQHREAARHTPRAAIREERTLDLAGKRSMSFAFIAPGTGGAIDSRGAEPTAQHWVAIPHQRDVLFLLLTCPEPAFGSADEVFRTLLATLEVTGPQTDQQAVPR
jgi:hypothetical protein